MARNRAVSDELVERLLEWGINTVPVSRETGSTG